MQKIFLLFMLTVSVTVFSQNRFSKINSIPELKETYKSVSEDEKNKYYDRYFKLKELQNLKNQPSFSNFSDKIMFDLIDLMYAEREGLDTDFVPEEGMLEWKQAFMKVETLQKQGKDIELEDLYPLFYRRGEYNGDGIYDIEAKGKYIYFTQSNGIGSGTFYNTYKVKGDKLIHVKTEQPRTE